MNKCFITKLQSSVDNDNLPVLGQLKISWLKQSVLPDNDARAIGLKTNDSITVKVSGAHFTDSTLTSNLGNTKTITAADDDVWLYVSNDADAVLTIDNKYSLATLSFIRPGKESLARSLYFDIEDIKYCTNLTSLNLAYIPISGDISALSKLTNLTGLGLEYTQISGDISALSKLTKLKWLDLSNDKVSGDISALKDMTDITFFTLPFTQINGDISAVSKLTKLTRFNISETKVSGDVDNLASLTSIPEFTELNGLTLTGDMSKIPTGAYMISMGGRKVNTDFTWTAKGRQNATLLAMGGNIPFDTTSMDNMLIDQATCTVSPNATTNWKKIISVKGTRTSASDAAVTAIQNKGITITGVTKAS